MGAQLRLVAAGVLGCCLLLLLLAARVDFLVNDDTYVYFNYARNWVEGRPFAYDTRGLPSEGFTSMLYLLLMLPGEALGIDPMLPAVTVNLLAVAACALLGARLVQQQGWVSPELVPLFAVLFLGLLVLDDNISVCIGQGLETLLSPASVLLALLPLTSALHGNLSPRQRRLSVLLFFAAAAISAGIRPENLLSLGVAGTTLLSPRGPGISFVLRVAAVFAGVGVSFAIAKLAVFGDWLPTGYYRKVGGGSGVGYALDALGHYKYALAGFAAFVVARRLFFPGRDMPGPGASRFAVAATAIVSWLAVFSTEPLVGHAFRYVINAYVLLYLALALAAVRLLDVWTPTGRRLLAAGCATAAAIVLFGALATATIPGDESLASRLALVRRAAQATQEHHYLALGRGLRERLPQHDEITVAFGDAGALPYALRSRFVDVNGLTEPTIARLFREPDGPSKTRRFLDVVLGADPDLVVLGFGPTEPTGDWPSPVNAHSPFHGPTPLAVFEAYREEGIEYVCSLRAYYDLHLGVRRGSPHASAIVAALAEPCMNQGYRLPQGFAVTEGAGRVLFSPWSR